MDVKCSQRSGLRQAPKGGDISLGRHLPLVPPCPPLEPSLRWLGGNWFHSLERTTQVCVSDNVWGRTGSVLQFWWRRCLRPSGLLRRTRQTGRKQRQSLPTGLQGRESRASMSPIQLWVRALCLAGGQLTSCKRGAWGQGERAADSSFKDTDPVTETPPSWPH